MKHLERYRKVQVISEKKERKVFCAYDEHLKKMVILKETRVAEGDEETEILKNLNHPLIVRLLDCFLEEDSHYLVLEYAGAFNLQEWVRRNGVPDKKRTHLWFLQMMEAVTYLHKQMPAVLHLDLKPENFIVTSDGDLRLSDFGSATRKAVNGKLMRRELFATFSYAPPEMTKPEVGKEPDERSDLYALGLTMRFVLTGMQPQEKYYTYEGDMNWERFIEKAHRAKREKRYMNITEMQKAFLRLAQKEKGRKWMFCVRQTLYYGLAFAAMVYFLQGICGKETFPASASYGMAALVLFYEKNRKGGKRMEFVQRESVLLARRVGSKLWGLAFGMVLLALTVGRVYASESEVLDITLRKEDGRKLLVKEDAILMIHESLVFEFPSEWVGQIELSMNGGAYQSVDAARYRLNVQKLEACKEVMEVSFRIQSSKRYKTTYRFFYKKKE